MKTALSLLCLTTLVSLTALASGAVVQTNYGTGDGSLPGGSPIVAANNLLSTRLASATRTGAGVPNPGDLYFYDENGGTYNVDLARLYDGQFGEAGGIPSASVLPNQVSLTFNFDLSASAAGYDLTSIRTYAGWNADRDGQQYTVEYSTAADPLVFLALASVSRFDNTNFPLISTEIEDENGSPTGQFADVPDTGQSSTQVWLHAESGFLAQNVAAVRFNFNGVESGGTGYREFVIEGSEVAAVPEPTAMLGTLGLLAGGLVLRRRNPRRH
jgi:hypothetical protein